MSSVELATITVRVPLAIRKRGGRKLVIVPTAEVGLSTSGTRIDSSMIKAVARSSLEGPSGGWYVRIDGRACCGPRRSTHPTSVASCG